jgi:hypothetical protein
MLGPAPDYGELPLDLDLAVERAREMEDRLRIDGLAARLPDTQSAALRHRVRRLAAPRRHALEIRRPTRPSVAKTDPIGPATGGGGLRWTIGIAAPNDKMAARWGDWHFASALARALDRRGHVGRVRTLEHESDPATSASDVRLVIRGLVPWPRRGRSIHVLWIISHPETVEASECDAADLVLVASETFAAELRTRTATPVEVLLQATDPVRFRRLPPTGAPARVVVVAKTRDAQRPIVTDAIAAGLRPAIYGTGWHGLVDPELVVADYVANAGLASVYSSAGVVLNDHWPSMRQWDFVSNRLFDVLACGTPAISDPVPSIETLFGDAVGQYHDRSELAALVEQRLSDPEGARRKVDAARRAILTQHTFDHRVDALLRLAAARGLLPAPPDGASRPAR